MVKGSLDVCDGSKARARKLRGSQSAYRNRLLATMGAGQLERLRPDLEPVDLPVASVLEAPHEPIAHVYFPEAGIGSVVVVGPRGSQGAEVGLFGRDGMSGLAVVLGDDRTPHETRVQLAGHGHRIPSEALREATREDQRLRDLFLHYALAAMAQSANTVLANARFCIEERLARWLLMCHDRMDGDLLEITHEFLAIMLGVRRAGVTVSIHMLEGQGLVKATRGRIRILDRDGLVAVSKGIYGPAEAEDARLMSAWASRA